MDCSKLTEGLVAAECNKIATAGAEDEVILLNFSEVDKLNFKLNGNVVESILSGKTVNGYRFATYGKSLDEAGATFTKGTYRNSWSHNVPLRIFVKDEEAKEFVNTFGMGARVMAILKNKETGTDGKMQYEVYGWDNGLELSESTSTIAMTDGIVYGLTIASSETAQESSLPKTVLAAVVNGISLS